MFKLKSEHQLLILADGLPIDGSTEDTPSEFFDMSRQADNLVILWAGTLNALGCPNENRVVTDTPDLYQVKITWTVPTESSNSTVYTVCRREYFNNLQKGDPKGSGTRPADRHRD